MHYEIKTEQFSGPLGKLLELIQDKKLEITTVSLAEVTGDFLEYLKNIEEELDPSFLADFIVVASRLVLIKSKVLLPSLELTQEEEGEIVDLEARLKIYNEFKEASVHIKNLMQQDYRSFGRPFLQSLGDQTFFYPPENLKASDLGEAVNALAQTLQQLVTEPRKIKSAIITIEQKIKELLTRFQNAAKQSFKGMSQGKPKTEVVAFFLAILQLLKDRSIEVEQPDQFSDIILKKTEQNHGS